MAEPQEAEGCWLAFYGDWSAACIFATEIDCLRYAVDHNMDAMFVAWGRDITKPEKT